MTIMIRGINDAHQRNRKLLSMDGEVTLNFGKYGLGTERTIDDYEIYKYII